MMRALGPGSVSSFLKVVLDVVYAILWVALAGVVIGAVALLIAQPFTTTVIRLNLGRLDGGATRLIGRTPALAGLLALIAVYCGDLIIVLNRLRRVFETLIQGDPFRPQNVARLREVGLALIALEAIGFLVHLTARLVAPTHSGQVLYLNLTGWFAILVVFVLAEVFREGARLRDEAELTI